MITAEQLISAQKANVETLIGLTSKTFEGVEQLVALNMMPLLSRTGFDEAQLRADQGREAAERALHFFAGHYQADVHEQRPLFLRRAAA